MAKILAVDDQEDNLDLLCQILEDGDYDVVTAMNGVEAVAKAEETLPDVILLDIHMPEMNGYEACEKIKANKKTQDIPVIFLTANTAEESVVKGLDLGAYDYITKPFNERELLARIGVMVRIREAEKKTTQLALTDTLTGLYNRRFLLDRFEEEIDRAKRNSRPLSCMIFDIDFFKKVNDTYGHDMGDLVLQKVASVLKEKLRGYDAIVRYGGEEFFVLFPETTFEAAMGIAERVRTDVMAQTIAADGKELTVTISIGVYGCPGELIENSPETYISRADSALYQAKEQGRNRVIAYKETE